ncbi:MAG TPA: hypothetical protein VFZ65_12585 [Planctomycetota bacterium]|nr:hypothetical protein [Planctomycetota bacterium]
MTNRDPDLDRITHLLGQCLGRIEEQSYRLQQLGDDDGEYDASDVFEHETTMLQELIAGLLASASASRACDLNRIVGQVAQGCLAEIGRPIVVRQRLAQDLPPIECAPGQVVFAVQRALMLALGQLEAGEELVMTTRREHESVVLELESRGTAHDRHLRERTVTLCEFLAGLGGCCRVQADPQGGLLLALELPHTLAAGEY